MNKVIHLILHCAATPEGKSFTAKDIDKMHKQRGFRKIGYHYVIDLDGTIEKGRTENETGAHCVGYNSKSLGICYIGGVAKDGKTPKDTRTKEQKQSMYELVDKLMKKYNLTLKQVHGHYEFANKACPSFKIEKFRQEFNEWKAKQNSKTVLLTNEKKSGILPKIFNFLFDILKSYFKK